MLLLCAAITSGISILEVSIASLTEKFGYSRKKASFVLFVIIAILAIPAGLSFNLLSDYTILKKTFFDFLDFATSNILMPLNTLFLCLIAGWCLKIKGSQFINNKIFAFLFDMGLKFIVPIILILLLYIGLK